MSNRRKSSGNSNKQVVNLSALSFVAVLLVGLSLLAAFVFGHISDDLGNIARVCQSIGLALAMLVPVIMSYRWAKHSKQWVFVLWIIAIVVILVFYVLNLVL